MGKKKNKQDGTLNDSSMVDVEQDIKENNKLYREEVVAERTDDETILSEMMHQYDDPNKKLSQKEQEDAGNKAGGSEASASKKFETKKKYATGATPLRGKCYLDEPSPTKEDMVLGSVIAGAVLAGIVTIGWVGVKVGIRIAKRLL